MKKRHSYFKTVLNLHPAAFAVLLCKRIKRLCKLKEKAILPNIKVRQLNLKVTLTETIPTLQQETTAHLCLLQ